MHFMPFHPTSEFAPPVGTDGSSMMLTKWKWGMADKVRATHTLDQLLSVYL